LEYFLFFTKNYLYFMSLSALLYLPLLIVGAFCLYAIYGWGNTSYAYGLIPVVILGAINYMSSPEIDWWWWKTHPPTLDDRIKKWLENSFGFYQRLSEANKERFRTRLVLMMRGTEYIAQGDAENIPEELKAMAAINAVWVGFGQEKFLFPKHQRVIFYNAPFPSIQLPQFHVSETFTDDNDGGVIIAAPNLMEGMNNMVHFYNVGLHEYAAVFQQNHPQKMMPAPDEAMLWEKLSLVSGINCYQLPTYMGTPTVDVARVGVVYFLAFPERFQAVFPEWYDNLRKYLNIDPVNGENPIMLEA
jgi:Mlc titration factor MtfA (ptsG expression regulator)